MRLAYADPPYPGCAKLYAAHKDYAGEVDHAELVARLYSDFDGFVLHTSSTALARVLPLCRDDVRVMAWVKPFAAFKRNVSVAYAWEPVLVKAAHALGQSACDDTHTWLDRLADGIRERGRA